MIHPIASTSRASIEMRDLNIFIRSIQPFRFKNVLEIGTWMGYSADVWIETFKPEVFITVDRDKRADGAVQNVDEKYHYLWEHDSQSSDTLSAIKEILGEKKIDFLFIDAGHMYREVRHDYEAYSELVREGGVIAFHDILYVDDNCQVKLLWDRLKQKFPYVECNLGEGSTGFGYIFNEQITSVAQKSQKI